MIARIQAGGEWHGGNTIESIVRREYGRKAYIRWSADRNSPEAGMIVRDNPHGTLVLDRLVYAEGDSVEFGRLTTPKNVGDRVCYVVHPFNRPDELSTGTIVEITDGECNLYREYHVYWDGIDRDTYPPVKYSDDDLVLADEPSGVWKGGSELTNAENAAEMLRIQQANSAVT